jgi:septal ring factor EnvC (AmiA/AmiB activator)
VDPEIKQRFDVLESALVRLAEGQAKTDATVRELAEGQAQTNATVRELAGDVRSLATAQLRTETRVAELAEGLGTLTDRVDRLAQLMIRGHTEAAERHVTVIDRLDKLEGS